MTPQLENQLERAQLVAQAHQALQKACRYMRSVSGEYLLSMLRVYSRIPAVARWYDLYAMALHRANHAEENERRLVLMDKFYTVLLDEADELPLSRRYLLQLGVRGHQRYMIFFKRADGSPHMIFPHLEGLEEAHFDKETAEALREDSAHSFSLEDLEELVGAIQRSCRTVNQYPPLAFGREPLGEILSLDRYKQPKTSSTSWWRRILNWFRPARSSVA
jgi:hypothetical protein